MISVLPSLKPLVRLCGRLSNIDLVTGLGEQLGRLVRLEPRHSRMRRGFSSSSSEIATAFWFDCKADISDLKRAVDLRSCSFALKSGLSAADRCGLVLRELVDG